VSTPSNQYSTPIRKPYNPNGGNTDHRAGSWRDSGTWIDYDNNLTALKKQGINTGVQVVIPIVIRQPMLRMHQEEANLLKK
jgi:hypothetical protein